MSGKRDFKYIGMIPKGAKFRFLKPHLLIVIAHNQKPCIWDLKTNTKRELNPNEPVQPAKDA